MIDLGRRRFIRCLAGATGVLAVGPLSAGESYDLTIRKARLIDPRQGIDAVTDIAVSNGRIGAIGAGPFAARELHRSRKMNGVYSPKVIV